MLNANIPHINIKKINLAHEFVLDQENKCTYPNGRNYYGIVYCIEGEAKYKFSSKKSCTVRDGDIIILSPKASYSIMTKKDFKHYTVNFEIHNELSNFFFEDDFYLFQSENSQWYANAFKK